MVSPARAKNEGGDLLPFFILQPSSFILRFCPLHPIRRGVTTSCPPRGAKLTCNRVARSIPSSSRMPMKILLIAIAMVVLFSALLAAQSASDSADARPAAGGAKGDRLYHVVSIKFKRSATKDQIKAVEDAFVGLKDKIPGVTSLTWGTNVSPEKHDKG